MHLTGMLPVQHKCLRNRSNRPVASDPALAGAPTAAATMPPPPVTPPSLPAPPPPTAKPGIPATLAALGTEPFWSARIAGARLTYTTPEDPQGQSTVVTRNVADFSNTGVALINPWLA